ncbi:hypothetical protein STA3757_49720 (plasmid) [Stanieria sp. NIES-3757]|nr:hypothetical protein STA3757_49720 [Stanieria sp. NIES-3757]
MKNKNRTILLDRNSIKWLRIIAAYQICRGIFGQSLLPFPVDFLFRILLCSSGVLVFLNKKIGIVLLLIVLIASIPHIEVVLESSFFNWPPIVLNSPINIGLYFTPFSMQDFSQSQSINVSFNFVYIFLSLSLKTILSEKT